ncbi:hypothetical protein GX586_11600 [bacterium]|nr:hypothetical protein [bacterium]
MSIIFTTYVPEGIVMASDSRQTATIEGVMPDGKKLPKFETVTSDNCYKLFLLEEQHIGVAVFGETILGGTPVEHSVRLFMEEYNDPKDDILDVVEKMMRHFSAKYPSADTAFHMCGYKFAGKVSVPYVYHCQVSRNEIKRINVRPDTDQVIYGTAWGGQSDIVAQLVQPGMRTIHGLNNVQVVNPPIIWDAMSVQDAIDFSIFTVWTTMEMVRFQARPKNVGGPIDVLLITPRGSGWIQRKDVYNDNYTPY